MNPVCKRLFCLLVVDDETESRRGVERLAASLGIACQTFASAEDFLAKYNHSWSGCLLVDLQTDPTHGLDLQARLADLGFRSPVIFAAPHGNVKLAVRAMRHGALTVLERPYQVDELADAVRMAMALEGRRLEALAAGEQKRRRLVQLTPRERFVMQLLADCTPRKAIMQRLGISLRTVERVCADVYKKTETDNPVALARLMAETGELPAPPLAISRTPG